MNYKIVTGNSPSHLEEKVNEMVRNGWILQGGVSSYSRPNSVGHTARFLQAMTWKGK